MIAIRDLVIHNMRGHRDLKISMKEKSIVLVGPNGSGKSSVVDALDFLLTGRVRRLEGEGAGGLSLADHGKHVDAKPGDAWVEATLLVGPHKQEVTIKRLVKPAKLEPETIPEELSQVFEQAERFGHHLLGRREILKFILATPSSRREQVAALLDIEEIDKQRKEISGALKEADATAKKAKTDVEARTRELLSVFRPPAADLDEVLERINAHRLALGAATVDELTSKLVCAELSAPETDGDVHPLRALEASLETLTADDSSAATIVEGVRTYLKAIDKARATGAQLADRQQQLFEAGLSLLAGDACPLCDSKVTMASLRKKWKKRLDEVAKAAKEIENLRSARTLLTSVLADLTKQARTIAQKLGGLPEGKAMADLPKAFAQLPPLPDPLDDAKDAAPFDIEPLKH